MPIFLTSISVLKLLTSTFSSLARPFFCLALVLSALTARADYPLISHKYSADPTGLEFNGRLYLYCSNDTDNDTNGYAMHSITCVSSDDLKNWTDHGEVLQVPRDAAWATYSWAPSAITNNGLVYLYFANGAGSIGVATSSVPTGPFKDARGSALINSSTPGASSPTQWYFDPCAFIDTDGQPYLYFGGSAPTNSRVIRLGANLTSVSGSATGPFTTNFFEASHMHQRNGVYYLTYSTTPSAGMTIYCETNSNPTNGFAPQGTVLPNPPVNVFNNNHHSIVSFGGNWYIAYHNRLVAKANGLLDAAAVYKRSLCLDALNYNPDGSIVQVTPTSNGLPQLKYVNPYRRNEAETIAQQSGILTEPCGEGGLNVTNVASGNWIMVRGVDFASAGATNFTARIAGAGPGGNIELRLDGTNGTLVGTCAVSATGGWQTWASVSCAVSNATARNVHDLYLKFTGASATNPFNFNWWQFQPATNGSSSPVTLAKFEAESGSLGGDWAVSNSSSPAYITILTDGAGNNPGSAARVASYTITFPVDGIYQLYGRVRTGPGTFNDDSIFYAASFGSKSPTLNSDWILVNGLAGVGFSNSTDLVTGGGSLGSGMWKWINLSQFTSQPGFTVSAGNLTQTFQIGARENGLDLDKFAFGSAGTSFTVSNLDNGTVPPASTLNTNLFIGPDGVAFHRFSAMIDGLNQDGANPAAGLALAGNVLVGTTLNGGSQGAGTAFTLSLEGTNFITLRTFTNAPDAGGPQSELAFSGGRFFSAGVSGGSSDGGAVFAGQTNGSVAVLRSFAAVNADNATNSGGASPGTTLGVGGGRLYGTTTAGGLAGMGTIFVLATNGATFSVLHDFSLLDSQAGTNADGAVPQGGLILSGDKLYGAASAGGAGGRGVIFSLGTNGTGFSTLYSFTPTDTDTGMNADGATPLGGLVLSNSTLYGTTFAGGQGGRGTIFSIQTNGSGFTVLHHFRALDPVTGTNTDGASPSAALLVSGNVLYGTASAGGAGAAGAFFAFNLASHQFVTLRSFTALAGNGTNVDGAFPVAPLLRVGGALYGTAFSGGPGGAGTVFSIPIPVVPAVITNVVRNPDSTITLSFLGEPNSTNVIQTAISLAPPTAWQILSTNVADANGAWQFTDGSSAVTRFYRSYAP